MENLSIIQINPERLREEINRDLKKTIEESFLKLGTNRSHEKEFLTRSETAEFFNVSVVTLHDWVRKSILKPYKMGNRTYFKYEELIESLKQSNLRGNEK